MGSVELLLDTNVLIEIWRGKVEPKKAIEDYTCGIETVAMCEFLQGVNHRKKQALAVLLKNANS